MNVQYTNAILDAIRHTFLEMLDSSIRFKNPIVKTAAHPSYEINAVMAISGEMSGCIALSFPKAIAIGIASTILAQPVETMPEALDALREIANMVSGRADTKLEMTKVTYSLPSVFVGAGKFAYPAEATVFSMECIMENGKFEIDIALGLEPKDCAPNEIC